MSASDHEVGAFTDLNCPSCNGSGHVADASSKCDLCGFDASDNNACPQCRALAGVSVMEHASRALVQETIAELDPALLSQVGTLPAAVRSMRQELEDRRRHMATPVCERETRYTSPFDAIVMRMASDIAAGVESNPSIDPVMSPVDIAKRSVDVAVAIVEEVQRRSK